MAAYEHCSLVRDGRIELLGFCMPPIYGSQPALFCEVLPAQVRYRGISLIYQIGRLIFLSSAPSAGVHLFVLNDSRPWLIAVDLLIAGIVSATSAMMVRGRA